MGMWGSGIFDSDLAQDVLGDIVSGMKERIGLEIKSMIDLGLYEMPAVAALTCLLAVMKKIDDSHIMVEKDVVEGWRRGLDRWMMNNRTGLVDAGFDFDGIKNLINGIIDELYNMSN